MSLNRSAHALLIQLKELISQLNQDHFTQPIEILSGSSIGQHIRHTLEFFMCLMDAKSEGRVCYDERRHDRLIETDPKLALRVADTLMEFLEKEQADFPIIHEANYELSDGPNKSMASSFYRELAYNIEHAIHHMALMKVGIRERFQYIDLPADFGVASSTIRFRKEAAN